MLECTNVSEDINQSALSCKESCKESYKESYKEALKAAEVDVDGAIAAFCNKEERYIKYLKLFNADDNFESLVIALENNDVREAFEHCHALKGVVGNLGFTKMFSGLYDACEILRNGSMEGVMELILGIEDNYRTINSIIEECLA